MTERNHFPYSLQWTSEAKAKLKKIPFFVRSQARHRIEKMAISSESEVITTEIVEEARKQFGN